MTTPSADSAAPKLRREMGFWDVMLFNIAAVLGPRWIAAAAHNGQSSLSLWLLAAVFFFMPTALVVLELSTRYPSEGGLYIWTKEAFGDFHGFIAGWCYWIYTFFYFPGLLLASVSMSVYIAGPKYAFLANYLPFQLGAALLLLAIAVGLNIVGLQIGKWLQNAGGVGTYIPLMMLVALAAVFFLKHGSATHFTLQASLPNFNFDTINFWSQIAFAFTGLELVCAMSEEVKNPRKTFPRAVYASGLLIAVIYILGTIALLTLVPAAEVDPRNGVFQALGRASGVMGIAWFGIMAALIVTVGNAGGVGTTVAGISRIPFVAGVDRYLPPVFGRVHPRWRTPYMSILIQAIISALVLVLFQVNENLKGAYQALVDAAIILNFLPFLYMYAACIRLAYRSDRHAHEGAVLIPGGRAGVWVAAGIGFLVVLIAIVLAMIPTVDVSDKLGFELKVAGSAIVSIGLGLALYWRGARRKRRGL